MSERSASPSGLAVLLTIRARSQLTHLNKITASGATDVASPGSESDVPHPSLPLLSQVITEFRDDELEHLDTAVEHDAQQAPAHALLSALIGFGCKGAIQIAKRF